MLHVRNQIDNVRRHYKFDSCKRKSAAAAMNLQVLQPPEKRQWLLCTSAMTTASPEEPSTGNESFASDDSIASVEEYVGLLGKEYAKYQGRRLIMDPTKLKNV